MVQVLGADAASSAAQRLGRGVVVRRQHSARGLENRLIGGCAGLATLRPDAEDRRATLALAPDVDTYGDQQHEALDDLHEVGAGTDELEAVVEERHDQTTDDGADDGTDTARD